MQSSLKRAAAKVMLIGALLGLGKQAAAQNNTYTAISRPAATEEVKLEAPKDLVEKAIKLYEENKHMKPNKEPEKYIKIFGDLADKLLEYDFSQYSTKESEMISNILNWVGTINYNNDKTDFAFSLYKKSVEINKKNDIAWVNLGSVYKNIFKDYKNALICYENALKINSNNIAAKAGKRKTEKLMKNK